MRRRWEGPLLALALVVCLAAGLAWLLALIAGPPWSYGAGVVAGICLALGYGFVADLLMTVGGWGTWGGNAARPLAEAASYFIATLGAVLAVACTVALGMELL